LQFVETDVVRWAQMELSIREHQRFDSLVDALLEKGREAQMNFPGQTVVRCTISGNGPLHSDLQRDGMGEELREELESAVPTESVRIMTGPELDLETLAKTETVVSDFLNLTRRAMEDQALRGRLAESLMPLFRRKELGPVDDARLREWIDRAGTLGVDLLLDS
jgi:hypothetical protein